MSWICKNCETENPDTMDVCEVCETHAPRIVVTYEKVFLGSPITFGWKVEYCDTISIVYKGETIDVSGKDSYTIVNPDDAEISFLLSNADTTVRTVTLSMEFIEKPSIQFVASKQKLKKGLCEVSILSWTIKNAQSAVLVDCDKLIEIPNNGTHEVRPDATTTYRIEAIAFDETTPFVEEIEVGVFNECIVDFKADKYYIFPTIPVTLIWKVEHAKTVTLDGEPVEAEGQKIIEPKKATTYILSAEDEFGVKEKRIDIKMLPIPQVKTLLVPTPKIADNLAITIRQPRYNVGVKFPQIDIGWIKAEVPRVLSLTDLGIDVKLSPPLPRFSLRKAITKVFNQIKKR